MMRTTNVLVALTAFLGACGGSVVGPDGSGGGTTTGTSTTTSATGSTSTGTGCGDGCPPNSVCIWGSGTCAPVCSGNGFGPCEAGLVCNDCATSSCENCLDCVAACVPATDGACDEHDDCEPGSACMYGKKKCAPKCGMNKSCADPKLTCVDCATSSCPACADCVGLCL